MIRYGMPRNGAASSTIRRPPRAERGLLPTAFPMRRANGISHNNSTGAAGADGVPDNYYLVSNPTQLQASLNRAFSQIIAKVASGTAASVVANASSGSGAVYQAFYEPAHEEPVAPNRTVNWLGTLQALFVGPDGNLYEDNNQDGQLEIGTDHQITFYFDPRQIQPSSPTLPRERPTTLWRNCCRYGMRERPLLPRQ